MDHASFFSEATLIEIGVYISLYRFGRTQLPSNSKTACKQNRHKPGPVAFNSGRLSGQEMLLAVNFEGKNIFYRK